MKYSQIVSLIAHTAKAAPNQATMIWGAPGCGKSHAATIGLRDALGLPSVPVTHEDSAVVMFRPSNHDPVDVTGLPNLVDGVTTWSPPDFLLRVNAMAKRYGTALLVIDELNQAVPMMFNTLNGLMLDRHVGRVTLDPGVRVVATGNRQTDKAASNRMPSHTANRLLHLDMESDLDGWTEWALTAGMPMWLIAFLRFKPELLNQFDADRRENPTERTWEMVGLTTGDDCPKELAFPIATGLVGPGAAAEVSAFREIVESMPNPDAVLMDPDNIRLPGTGERGALFALCGAIAHRATKENFDRVVRYTKRIPPEFGVLTVRDAFKRNASISSSRAFVEWVSANSGVLN